MNKREEIELRGRYIGFWIMVCLMIFSSCTRQVIRIVREDSGKSISGEDRSENESMQTGSDDKEKPADIPHQSPTPMQTASLRLTDQARRYLEKKDTESAIRTLERAVSLHPNHGENYFLLAEAWRIKGNREQALEFNRLAELYLKHDRTWMDRIELQRSRIEQNR
ncbi:MAG: hypothetical protein AB1659_06725 [Thermodesulfobacteriota bacterium]